jgi:hypothetical protein
VSPWFCNISFWPAATAAAFFSFHHFLFHISPIRIFFFYLSHHHHFPFLHIFFLSYFNWWPIFRCGSGRVLFTLKTIDRSGSFKTAMLSTHIGEKTTIFFVRKERKRKCSTVLSLISCHWKKKKVRSLVNCVKWRHYNSIIIDGCWNERVTSEGLNRWAMPEWAFPIVELSDTQHNIWHIF